MNCTIKETLSKLYSEASLRWTELLPLALFRPHCTPQKHGFFSFEVRYGRPTPHTHTMIPTQHQKTFLPICPYMSMNILPTLGNLNVLGDVCIQSQLKSLGQVLKKLHAHLLERDPIFLGTFMVPSTLGMRSR